MAVVENHNCAALDHVDGLRRPPVRLEVKLLHPAGRLPTKHYHSDAGWDVASIARVVVPPRSVANIETGIAVSPPLGTYVTVEGRSSLWRQGIIPIRGIIDATYSGALMVALANNSDEPYVIEAGDRIAQLLVHEVSEPDIVLVTDFSHQGGRQERGFGSSGR